MSDFKERRFSIDPGKGKKMDGCPYSVYEDGRDVQDYIIPPKGYIFKGFRFDPDACNQIYDGKLIAVYEKETFNERMKSNLWKFLLAFGIIAVIGIVIFLAVSVFNKPKPPRPEQKPEPVVSQTDTAKKNESTALVIQQDSTSQAIDTVKPAEVNEVDANLNDNNTETEVSQPTVDDVNTQFKQAFWTLIHQRTIMMDPYDLLFKEYKNKVEGEEYDYLRFTILKDYNSFKAWYHKLHKVPVAELEQINTINDLKNKLNEIE